MAVAKMSFGPSIEPDLSSRTMSGPLPQANRPGEGAAPGAGQW